MTNIYPSFWEKIDKVSTAPCWKWLGLHHPKGYARTGSKMLGTRIAHRVTYLIMRGEIPKGLELDHLCRNRGCVNPDHLEAVTHEVNVQRGISGEVARARQKGKTHCKWGHPYSQENTIIKKTGARGCHTCTLTRQRLRQGVLNPRL